MTTPSAAALWLPGFAPHEDPITTLGASPEIVVPPPPSTDSRSTETKPIKAVWPLLEASALAGLDGDVAKFEANVAALQLLKRLTTENRNATAEERGILVRYTGWGGLPQAFNPEQNSASWAERARRLSELLDPQELQSARLSTPNAHYTPPEIAAVIWEMVWRLGFRGGRVLEPAAGVGHFIGAMPQEIARASTVTAVELDVLSAAIADALYGPFGVTVYRKPFEAAPLPSDYFDLAISNVPFGHYQVAEVRKVPYANFSIHNYFFAKALEVVRPGGLVAFITSSYTLDARDNGVRRYLAAHAEMVAAIRLPNITFKKIASTKVTTDIIVLQKRPWTKRNCQPVWLETRAYRQRFDCNAWFANNPQWIVGELAVCDNGYRPELGCVFSGQDLVAELAARVSMLPQGIYVPPQDTSEADRRAASLLASQKPGFTVIDGRLYEVRDGRAVRVEAPTKTLARISGLVGVRDAARKLIEAQVSTDDDALLSTLRATLNAVYDAFVAKHGYLHDAPNRRAFAADPDLPLLLSLERWDEKEKVGDKAEIFFRRTAGLRKAVERCDSVHEALTACLAENGGRVDPKRIGALVDKSAEDAMRELEESGAAFLNPQSGQWESADQYLSGNVREKLAAASCAGHRFAGNAQALRAVLPRDLTPSEIIARIGAPWIPGAVYANFLDHLLDIKGSEVTFDPSTGSWSVSQAHGARWSVASTQVYGTERINAVGLFEQALNQVTPKIYDTDPETGARKINQRETVAAREKQMLLQRTFSEWLWSNQDRALALTRLYNERFNSYVRRRYDGRHLTLPGFSEAYQLRGHQRDAIWRIVTSGTNTLLAHPVGAGKTLVMICAGMELRRLGIATKPMYVVPNHMLEQFTLEFLRAYPSANVLMASKDDLAGDKRRHLLSRIATDNWDAVVITHASFERLKVSDATLAEFIENEIAVIEEAIRAVSARADSNRIVKELARAHKTWEARLQKLSAQDKKDRLLSFEQLGIDWLFVDEAHCFKNLYRHTKMTRVAGLPMSNSERAFDLFVKTRIIMRQRRSNTGIVFATATPVANSMAELWVMQRYLQPDALERAEVSNFDSWAANFGEAVTGLELAPDGSGYRVHTRFSRFINVPDLMAMFSQVADVRDAKDLDLPVPDARRETIVAKRTEELAEYVSTLVRRAERIRSGAVRPSEDNMLAVTNDGRKAALDMRLVDPSAVDHADNKLSLCATKVHEIWIETASVAGTQLVFCDLSTPCPAGGFSAYRELRRKLIALGVPDDQIAFIHDYDSDADKERLFDAVRQGQVRILIGSTSKMGVGTNVQDRLAALHHLDAPWRPADVEQREGRIIRQGNRTEVARIYRYVTEGSFDAYIWQTLETKARFIAQVMQGETCGRSAEDVELAALSYAEVKALASGNPLVIEKAGVDAEVLRLQTLKAQWQQQRARNVHDVSALPKRIASLQSRIEAIAADLAEHARAAAAPFRATVSGQQHADQIDAGKAILLAARSVKPGAHTEIGQCFGFALVVYSTPTRLDKIEATLLLRGRIHYEVGDVRRAEKVVPMILETIGRLDALLANERTQLALTQKRLADLKAELDKPFEHEDRLRGLLQRQLELNAALACDGGDNNVVLDVDDEVEVA